jgi:phosphopantothenoylcysteine decarboxylase/phosphopantothenate--cysteine ligase
LKVLVTAGGTEEPIDGVRRLVNGSTGMTGLALAEHFSARGAEVHLLHSRRVDVGKLRFGATPFITFDDLAASLRELLGSRRFDAVAHVAAVGDYRLDSVEVDGAARVPDRHAKISSGRELVLRFKPNPKLIDHLKNWSANPDLKVVGFKLTNEPESPQRMAKVKKLLERGVADLVVHNDLGSINTEKHIAILHSEHGVITTTQNKQDLARAIFDYLAAGELA